MSVGHLARLFEEGGIATVVVAAAAFRDRLQAMTLPRVLLTPFPMGRPLGAPGDGERQREVVEAALALLAGAAHGGTLEAFPALYRARSRLVHAGAKGPASP